MTKEEILARVQFHAELRGLSQNTQSEYVTKVRGIQDYFDRPASELELEHVQQFLHYLLKERKLSSGSINSYNSGLRFLFRIVLQKPLNTDLIPCHKKSRAFPDILTPTEIQALFHAAKNLRDKTMLVTMYGAGLRLNEVATLRVSDIDSENMQIFIRNGKGNKDRFALLSQNNLDILRQYWLQFRPRKWLFTSLSHNKTDSHISPRGVQNAFHFAVQNAGIKKKITTHTLRHSFATHLLENGVSIFHIKQLLGHSDISTTCFYLHLVKISEMKVKSPLDNLSLGDFNG